MIGEDVSIRRIYIFTAAVGLLGGVAVAATLGIRPAIAFVLGALASCGNLWLFDWVSSAVGPRSSGRKSWQTLAYILRYVLLIAIGYGIVRILKVSPLAVILGLLASSAAVLFSLVLEIFSYALRGKTSR